MTQLGIIIIGRNEGQRLQQSLSSACGQGCPVIYVDSGSTDGSAECAAEMGIEALALDDSIPFTAARARNAGFDRLLELYPDTRLVQFIDGDCVLVGGWLQKAARELEARTGVAVICGRRRETHPEYAIYNRLADLEWDAPVGEVHSCGGDFMVRADAFRAMGGFEPSIAAGEEPELCRRLRNSGWTILRMVVEMTRHDSGMLTFKQWWRRSVRSGYGAADVETRFCGGAAGPFASQVRSARLWCIGWPLAVLLGTVLTRHALGATAGYACAFILMLALPAQFLRIARRLKSRAAGPREAASFAALILLGKAAHLVGQIAYLRDRRSGRPSRLIEYKSGTEAPPLNEAPSAWFRWLFGTDFRADLDRYPHRSFLREQSLWAIALYRLGRRNDQRPAGVVRWFLGRSCGVVNRIVETLTGISLPRTAVIGPGLRIYHFGNIFIHADARIGNACTLRQGVTIGNREEGGGVPILESGVELGAYAQVLGAVRIGNNAKIGAMSVVLCDIPAHATAVGVPARVIMPDEYENDLQANDAARSVAA